jgi:arginase
MHPEIYLIGLPTDSNSSFERGAAGGPAAIRAALFSDRGNMSCENGSEIGVDIHLHDRGDLALSDIDVSADDEIIRSTIGSVAASGGVPIMLGGDHSVTYPIIAALAAHHGPVHILHFDAHPDLYDDFEGNPRSHASPFARIMEAELAASLTQVGIRTLTSHCRDQANRFDVNIIPMAGFAADKVQQITGPLYISIDLDGIDPSEAPGVAHPEPGGLTVRELLSILNHQTAQIIGADIVELNPARDVNDVTAILAAKLVRELSSIIVRNSN